MEYRNSFPFVISYELRKFFPYVPEIHNIVMIFLSFLQLELNRCSQNSTFTPKVHTEEH